MNSIEFTKEHLSFNEEQQEYWIEIPKEQIDTKIESVQIVNEDGSFSQADVEIREDDLTYTVSLEFPANLRVNFSENIEQNEASNLATE
ncbi:hypothetical protein OF897_11965 [Chryseobacterium formosus]|uniref:Uncharacterized protein n=1 Tax=Chryseobacterium formosus TaxID=1537363 RepID=A0ABT3XR75_9FLAO|nr:hypothetical protein [Chryseobacterium formosus]MCX8524629.1 hypothetical protein [Chryseobacterium formosus]